MLTPSMRQRGFTLIELLASLAISCVLFATAAPNFTRMVQDSRRTALLNHLLGSVQLARSEAAMRGRVVVMCPSADGATCGSAAAWNQGWIVFVNLDGDPAQRDAAHEPLLQVFATGRSQTVSVNFAGGGDAIQLRPFDTRSTNGTVTVCDSRGTPAARAVVVGVMGRPYVSSRDGSRHPLVCG